MAVTNAVLMLPLFAFQIAATSSGPTALSLALQVTNVLLFMFVIASLRSLLTQRCLGKVAGYLAAIIVTTLLLQALTLAMAAGGWLELGVLLLVGLVALGVLYIVVGIKLLHAASALAGLRLFAYSAIAVGVFSASVVLALAALPASMVMNVALAIVFFRAAAATAQPQ